MIHQKLQESKETKMNQQAAEQTSDVCRPSRLINEDQFQFSQFNTVLSKLTHFNEMQACDDIYSLAFMLTIGKVITIKYILVAFYCSYANMTLGSEVSHAN